MHGNLKKGKHQLLNKERDNYNNLNYEYDIHNLTLYMNVMNDAILLSENES